MRGDRQRENNTRGDNTPTAVQTVLYRVIQLSASTTTKRRRRQRGRLKGSDANKLVSLPRIRGLVPGFRGERGTPPLRTTARRRDLSRCATPLPFNCLSADDDLINAISQREITISRTSKRMRASDRVRFKPS